MAGTQRPNTSVAHRFGYGLGQMVKRVRAAWFRMENRLIQSAGKHAPLVKAGLLLLKVLLGAAGLAAVLFAAFWLAAIVLGVFALITFGGGHEGADDSALESFAAKGPHDSGIFQPHVNSMYGDWD